MTDQRHIVVEDWDTFLHYRDRRAAPWIKNDIALLRSDDYLALTLVQRGALHGLWLEYARANYGRPVSEARPISVTTAGLSRLLGARITGATLEALNHAGFITFRASEEIGV